ncbi:transcriptional regulators containing an AAA-type ATPase domain and a DNA-binding domain [Synechococcus sp. PCC 7502]|uniref:sigma 54-interacting transcriptional regulator n=1 Tax=Synechococcus sp. PCC 7502 TaxID=1173263 RepID=UPI00029FBC23|nr:sigma 54-interacting transcriptional regulator [Synechococcus sp. PCC 7502]AFY72482.1 transcriptional regulators containing an AAA-type ATPase domain and a DNA-binding domain [Synechococcus sp. PCC 7502]
MIYPINSPINSEWISDRTQALQPYLVNKAERGIIGKSRYAIRLRQDIKNASSDRQPVIIIGEAGLDKDNIAALIHFNSAFRREAIAKVNCRLLQASGAELFGRVDGNLGILTWLGQGTLILNNIEELPKELIPKIKELLEKGTFKPVGSSELAPDCLCEVRIILVSEKHEPAYAPCRKHTIKVPALRVRKSDIKLYTEYYISLYCRDRGLTKPKLTEEALRSLQNYDFPENLKELQSLVSRAIVQSLGATVLTESVFWSNKPKSKRFRFNLLNANPNLRKFLRSDWFPTRLNYWVVLPLYTIVVIILFLAPQTRDRNLALNLFWAWWWPLILIAFPFVGRLWCSICPFMIYGEVTQKLSLWLFPRNLKQWDRAKSERWSGWFLWGLFLLIYLWEELWDLQNTAYLSAYLLLLITAGAVICSLIFERRYWCRYLCPIGGMNGLFAKLSITELRADQGTCSAECTTYQCYKGGVQKGEGLETNGCPLYSHPAQLQDNRDCVLCMTCLKACPHRSVKLNLRPPAIELWTTHIPRNYEVALLLLLLGGAFLHRLPEIQLAIAWQFEIDNFLPHLCLSVLILLVSALIPVGAYWIMRSLYILSVKLRGWKKNSSSESQISICKPRPFIQLAYSYLPLVLGGNLAHYLRLFLQEAGRILPVSFATFGMDGSALPIFIAHPAVISFLQATTLLLSVILTLALTQKIARQPWRSLIPFHISTLILAIALWKIIV